MFSNNPTFHLTRFHRTEWETVGHLEVRTLNTTFHCAALELPWRGNATSISCIPTGEYNIFFDSGVKLFRLSDVPSRTSIRLDIANHAQELEGCIALGRAWRPSPFDGRIALTESRDAYAALIGFLSTLPIIKDAQDTTMRTLSLPYSPFIITEI